VAFLLARAVSEPAVDLADPESEVSRLAESPRGSKLLEDLGTAPKVTYLQAVEHA
jgi:hypothetical protein